MTGGANDHHYLVGMATQILTGPMLRYTSETEAVVWLELDRAGTVEILGTASPSFEIRGHHFALVVVEGLTPGHDYPYEVRVDGAKRWPPPDYRLPQPRIRTLPGDSDVKLAFGSCRGSGPHRPPYIFRRWWHPKGKGIDALNAYAQRMVGQSADQWPDALVMLGDQLYADQPPPAVQAAVADREVHPDGPDNALEDFEEFTIGYRFAWTRSLIRWLFSTVPTMMILDDHEINDKWRTSRRWMEEKRRTSWYRDRVVGGLMAYWLYQHLGNLSPEELKADPTYRRVLAGEGDEALREFATRAEAEDGRTRFSFSLDLGPARLVAVDSRAGRVLQDGERRIVGAEEWDWVKEKAAGHSKHLVLASSLPFLLPQAMHNVEAWSEAVDEGAWGNGFSLLGEKVRNAANLDHWAAFRRSFAEFEELVIELAGRSDRKPPESLLLLGGDVHHCFTSHVDLPADAPESPTAIRQVVCSSLRKELELSEMIILGLGHTRLAEALSRPLARSAGIPPPRLRWRETSHPYFRNQIGTLEFRRDRVDLTLERGSGRFGRWGLRVIHRTRLA